MAGALLRTGSLREFSPLGAVGNPVYRAASQLRAAMRRQVSSEVADVFAVPRQNEQGDVIDWYASFPGVVVPWSGTTPPQRAQAKAQLLEVRELLARRSKELQEHESSEQKVFGQLLTHVTSIPSDEHVYLVDGRPVITFWGFDPLDPPPDLDVIAQLDVGLATASRASSSADPIVHAAPGPVTPTLVVPEAHRGWRWWMLLPLLLLMLLGLLAFRACTGRPLLPGIGLIRDLRIPVPRVTEAEYVEYRGERYRLDRDRGELIDPATGLVDRQLSAGEIEDLFGGTGGGADETETAPGATPDPAAERAGADPEAGAPQASVAAPPAPSLADAEPSADAEPPTKQAAEPRPSAEGPAAAGDAPAGPDAPSGEPSRGTPLTIPPQAVKGASSEFLSGKWRSITGLMGKDGQPVEVFYDFEKGSGAVEVHRMGSGGPETCTGQVGSQMRDGKLVLDQNDIRCPDGSGFQDSTVECAVGQDGKADCKGVNQNGTRYDVQIVK